MKWRKKIKKLIALLFTFVATKAFATYTCTGIVEGLTIDPKLGTIAVEKLGTLRWIKFCIVDQEENGVSPEACKLIYTTLLSAQMSGKTVKLWFNDGKDCSIESHAPWLNLTGWYFGPKIHK